VVPELMYSIVGVDDDVCCRRVSEEFGTFEQVLARLKIRYAQ
jgi:hypothetical protein